MPLGYGPGSTGNQYATMAASSGGGASAGGIGSLLGGQGNAGGSGVMGMLGGILNLFGNTGAERVKNIQTLTTILQGAGKIIKTVKEGEEGGTDIESALLAALANSSSGGAATFGAGGGLPVQINPSSADLMLMRLGY